MSLAGSAHRCSNRLGLALAGFCLGGLGAAAGDGPPVLVKDIFTATASSTPTELVDVDGTLFFAADDGTHGQELWKSDGTAAGTVMVADIVAGADGAQPRLLTNVNGTLMFFEGPHGKRLWRSEGTAPGTVLVKDGWDSMSGPAIEAARVGEVLFFVVSGSWSDQLWTSNGTETGTTLLMELGSPRGSFTELTDVAGTLFALATRCFRSGSHYWCYYDLLRSDGTVTGTEFVHDAGSGPRTLVNAGGTLFWGAERPPGFLFRSDGTPTGRSTIRQLDCGPMIAVGATLFISGSESSAGAELWMSDGSTEGTVLVRDIRSGTASSQPEWLVDAQGILFFTADDGSTGRELWRSDGTTAGTVLVRDVNPGAAGSSPTRLIAVGGTLYFVADDGESGPELWRSDGTPAGTVLVKDIVAGRMGSDPVTLTASAGTLYFVADADGVGREVWVSAGEESTTHVLTDINTGRVGSAATFLAEWNGTLYFAASDGALGEELWRSDGTTAGSVLVADINPGPASSEPRLLAMVDGSLFFAADDGQHGIELWRSDGTASGTVMVKDIYPGSFCATCGPHGSYPRLAARLGGTLLFTAWGGSEGVELWRSDGTAAGTALVADINAGEAWSSPDFKLTVGGHVFFFADDGATGIELWKSDGTTAGTVLVKDIRPGSGSGGPGWMSAPAGTLLFTANSGTSGYELWRSDGTEAGTVMVKDIRPGPDQSYPTDFHDLAGALLFAADDGNRGRELWRSDGTADGTAMVADLRPGSASSAPHALTWVGDHVFLAADGGEGVELWKTQGTDVSTLLVRDIAPGPSGSSPTLLRNLDGTLYFVADDGASGSELWRSDGSVAGTTLVADLRPGVAGAAPAQLMSTGRSLFFVADDGLVGGELWRITASLEAPALTSGAWPLLVGAPNTVRGRDFTDGSVVKLYIATGAGADAYGPYTPANWSATQLTFAIPPDVPLGNGFASVQVINPEDGYRVSNAVAALLLGSAAAGIPSVTHINGVALAPAELSIGLAHVDTVVGKGETLTIAGTGFVDPVVNVFTASNNIGPIAPLPGATTTRIQVTLPASAPTGPGNVQVVNRPSYRASNAVSSVIGAVPTIASVSVADETITVAGTGFSTLAVVNLFNRQAGTVVNLGGYGPGGAPRVPLTVVSDTVLTFVRPAGAVAGPAFVEVLNPPFIPFSSSVTDPDGAFTMPGAAPLRTEGTIDDVERAVARDVGDGAGRDGTAGAAGRNVSREPVTWTRSVGAAADGDALTAADGRRRAVSAVPHWVSGARSTRALLGGDGYVTWTVHDGAGDVALGFDHTDLDGGLADLDFAWRLDATTRELLVYEGGRQQAAVGTFAPADRLRIAVRDGVVEYRRNGTLMWTSTQVPQYPLIVDASLGSPGATLRGVRVAGRLGTVVDWPAQAGAATASMRVTADITLGAAGPVVLGPAAPGDAGAAIARAVSADLVGAAGIGFGVRGCDYCIVRADGAARVRHAGTVRGPWPLAPAMPVRVEIDAAGLVRYWAGDVRLDEAPLHAAAPLGVQGWLGAPGAAIAGATVAVGGGR